MILRSIPFDMPHLDVSFPLRIDRPINGDIFTAYVEKVLVLTPVRGDILVP
jgi:hypothetical protein